MTFPPKHMNKDPYYKTIGTHDGFFHCDDVTACCMLKTLKRFKDHHVVRTRDEEELSYAEVVVDVGSVFDIDRLRLDHHQRSFQKTIHDFYPNLKTTNPENPPRLSSSGIVYCLFGKQFIKEVLRLKDSEENTRMVDAIFEKAYVEIFEEIDAIDNGVSIAEGDNVRYNYHVNSGISSRVARLNPDHRNTDPKEMIESFYVAMNIVAREIIEGIEYLAHTWWPERQKYRKFFEERHNIHPSGQIVRIEPGSSTIGWASAITDLEEEAGVPGQVKYIMYLSSQEEPQWRMLALSIAPKSFVCRVPLKEEWRGKRDEELQKASGIEDATFVHNSGFTGGARSEASALKMIKITLGLED